MAWDRFPRDGVLAGGRPVVAFFDLDRTLVPRHTALLYLRLMVRDRQESPWTLLRAASYLLLYFFNLVDMERVAREAVRRGAGLREDEVRARGQRCVAEEVVPALSREALAAVTWHREQGHHVCLVTATPDHLAGPLATHLGMGNLCTRLEAREGVLTGEIDGTFCCGAGKVALARPYALARGALLADCWFYSDSGSDLPLLEAVGHPVAVNADPLLRRVARARGWPLRRFT
jgi:HAD superfamily hydrolase (TIGR01490 family)